MLKLKGKFQIIKLRGAADKDKSQQNNVIMFFPTGQQHYKKKIYFFYVRIPFLNAIETKVNS